MNKGFYNEKKIKDVLTSVKFKDLSNHWKSVICYIYKDVQEEDIITSCLIGGKSKTDLSIYLNHSNRVNISIKLGENNSIHEEEIPSFVEFLKSLNIKQETIDGLLLYHYGDGTLDGSGDNRLSSEILKIKYQKEIKELNFELNKTFVIRKLAERCLFTGRYNYQSAEYIYYGDEKYGIICSKERILDYLSKKYCLWISTPHFGPLTYQPSGRSLNHTCDEKRKFAHLKWITLMSDLQKACDYEKNKKKGRL